MNRASQSANNLVHVLNHQSENDFSRTSFGIHEKIHDKVIILSSVESSKSIILYNYMTLNGPKADAIVVGIGTGNQEQGSTDWTTGAF